jgi:hypothetical protein
MNDLAFLSLYAFFFAGVGAIAFWASRLDRKPSHPAPGE